MTYLRKAILMKWVIFSLEVQKVLHLNIKVEVKYAYFFSFFLSFFELNKRSNIIFTYIQLLGWGECALL